MSFIGNDPFRKGFDPEFRARQSKPGSWWSRRGAAFRIALLGGTALLIPGVLLQKWAQDWWAAQNSESPVEITAATGKLPDFRFQAEEPAPAKPPPVVAAPPPTKLRASPAATGTKERELPTQIAFNVQPQGEPPQDWFVDGRRPRLAHGCALRPGASLIHAALETKIESEVAGQAIATVVEDVMDADGVGRPLIPAGTKAVGVYKSGGGLSFQSERLDFVWTELTFPDGTQINLGEANGMNVAGSMGVGGQVTTRWGQLIAMAALTTVFDGIQRGAVSDDPSLAGAMQNSASRTTGRLGRDVTNRVLDWEPRIVIEAGTRIIISPQRTIQVC